MNAKAYDHEADMLVVSVDGTKLKRKQTIALENLAYKGRIKLTKGENGWFSVSGTRKTLRTELGRLGIRVQLS